MKNLKYICLILYPLLFSGCEKVVEFTGKDIQPMLVANCILSPDSTVTIDLTRSISALEDLPAFPPVKNATISFSDNSSSYTNFSYYQKMDSILKMINPSGFMTFEKFERGYYKNHLIKIEPGKKYYLEVNADGFEKIKAETEIPVPVPIEKLDTFHSVINSEYSSSIEDKADLYFNDPVQSNFYRIEVEQASLNAYFNSSTGEIQITPYFGPIYFSSDDPVFGEKDNTGILGNGFQNQYMTFNDQLFNGKSYHIKLTYYTDYYYENDSYNYSYNIFKVKLVSLSESYFNYLNTVALQDNSENDLFANPALVYTNIENGTGIFGASSSSDKYLIVNNFSEEMMSQLPFTDDASLFSYIRDAYSKLYSGYFY